MPPPPETILKLEYDIHHFIISGHFCTMAPRRRRGDEPTAESSSAAPEGLAVPTSFKATVVASAILAVLAVLAMRAPWHSDSGATGRDGRDGVGTALAKKEQAARTELVVVTHSATHATDPLAVQPRPAVRCGCAGLQPLDTVDSAGHQTAIPCNPCNPLQSTATPCNPLNPLQSPASPAIP